MGQRSSQPADAPESGHRQASNIAHVVGIGASAGGLEALQDLAAHLVASGGTTYVVAQHLAPEHRSLIVDLLARSTGLTVVTAVDGAPLQPDVIAIAPPNHDVAVAGERLRLSDPLPRFGPSPCIDLLFESIAEHWGERGVAVVLSGTGSDGARGVQAVRAAGGLTLAQAPASAKFDAMPRAAISLGGAELVLEPAAIGRHLGTLMAAAAHGTAATTRPAFEPAGLEAVTGQLRHVSGIDFSQYKESTLRRQLQRRLAIRQVDSLEAYLPLLAAEPEEAQALVQNLLVTVTEFFRDPEAFDALRELLRDYVEQRGGGERLRVWVPGCATGKEVYSIAMVVSEVLGHPANLATHLKIFGTDLDEPSLTIGRRGIYPLAAASGICADRRSRFVIEHGEEIEICEALRNCAVFARHDVGADPPFPNLDLISCRNTLIYFTPPMQERVLNLFRFGLRPGGLLFLGSSESLGGGTEGFAVANADHRLFRRSSEGETRQRSPQAITQARQSLPFSPARAIAVLRETVPEQHMALLEALVRAICPPALVLDESHDLVEVIGDVTPYCRLPEGRMRAAALAFLLPELQSEARALFLLARADGIAVGSQPLKLADSDSFVRLEARSIQVSNRAFTVLSFAPAAEAPSPPPGSPSTARDAAFDREIERLERELLSSQDSLRRSLSELEQANEALEATSEELQASSEELQSSNEELEASNEELQATNDELGTLNEQLRARGEALEQLNDDLENIQSSLSQGMVIVDPQLRVSRFSPLAVRVFGLMEGDIGQPLLGVPTTVPLPGLAEALRAVVGGEPRRSLETGSEEVAYLVQVQPYLERDGRRRGAIVTLTDVSELVALRRTAEDALDEFASLTDALDQAVWKWDRAMQHLLYVSKRIQVLTGWTPAELCDQPALLAEAIDPADRERVAAARAPEQGHWSVRYRLNTRDGRQIWVLETARVMSDSNQPSVVATLADVTELRALEQRASELSATFESVFDARSIGVAVLDGQLRVVMANQTFSALVGFDPASIVGVASSLFAPEAEEELGADARAALAGSPRTDRRTLRLKGRDGSVHAVQAEIRAMRQPVQGAQLTIIVPQYGQ